MLKKMIFAVAAAAAALGASSAAFARDEGWDHDRGRGWGRGYEHREHDRGYRSYPSYAPRPFVVVPAPRVVYAPPPRVAYPYYAAPVYSAPGVSIRFDFPL